MPWAVLLVPSHPPCHLRPSSSSSSRSSSSFRSSLFPPPSFLTLPRLPSPLFLCFWLTEVVTCWRQLSGRSCASSSPVDILVRRAGVFPPLLKIFGKCDKVKCHRSRNSISDQKKCQCLAVLFRAETPVSVKDLSVFFRWMIVSVYSTSKLCGNRGS